MLFRNDTPNASAVRRDGPAMTMRDAVPLAVSFLGIAVALLVLAVMRCGALVHRRMLELCGPKARSEGLVDVVDARGSKPRPKDGSTGATTMPDRRQRPRQAQEMA